MPPKKKFVIGKREVTEEEFEAEKARIKAEIGEAPEAKAPTLLEPGGVDIPELGTFFGLKKEDIAQLQQQQIAEGRISPKQPLIPLAELREREERAAQVGQRSQAGIEGFIAPEISLEQAQKVGIARGVIGAAAGATLGQLGKVVGIGGGAGAGAVGLPIIAAGGGFIQGMYSDLKSQSVGIIQADKQVLIDNKTNLRRAVKLANAGADPIEMLDVFNNQLSRIDAGYSHLKARTQTDLNVFLGEDGTKELMEYEDFYAPGGLRDIMIIEMRAAMLNPDPSKALISTEDIPTEQ